MLVDQHVPRVQVAVEDPVGQRVLEHPLDGQAHQPLAVERRAVGGGRLGVGPAGHPLHDHHPLADQAGDRPGDAHLGQARVLGDEAQLDHVERLEPEVELLEYQLREQLDDAGQVGGAHPLDAAVGRGGDERQGLDGLVEPRPQPGPPHLDDDVGAVGEDGAVRLADRGRPQRLGVERAEQHVDREVEGPLDDALGLAGPHGRHLVAAPAEGVDPVVGQQAAGGGDELAELDVGRPAVAYQPLDPGHEGLGSVGRPDRQAGRPRPAPTRAKGASGAAAPTTFHPARATAATVSCHSRGWASPRAWRASRARSAGWVRNHPSAASTNPGRPAAQAEARSIARRSGSGGAPVLPRSSVLTNTPRCSTVPATLREGPGTRPYRPGR